LAEFFLDYFITSVSNPHYLEVQLKNSRPAHDLVDMSERSPTDANNDRRRSPRFNCGGYVEVHCLPSNGIYLPGKVRDLSLDGCCIETALPVECGARAEIVVRIKTGSFRAVGEVRAIRNGAAAGVEFVRLSAAGKDLLAELVGELARLEAAITKLRTASPRMDPDLFRKELNYRKLQAEMISTRFPFLANIAPEEGRDQSLEPGSELARSASPGSGSIVDEPLVIRIDLFG
jgi:hypothetical protein